MPFYPAVPSDVTPDPAGDACLALLGQAGMVAVRVADLASPAGRELGKDGRTALVAAGTGKIVTGDLVVFCKLYVPRIPSMALTSRVAFPVVRP